MTTKSSYTPGPWRVDAPPEGDVYIQDNRSHLVAVVPEEYERNNRTANARLMAAAPELRAMLITLHALIQSVREGANYDPAGQSGSFSEAADYAEDNARALLTRIDGQEP